jgi:hypothetical protein
VKSREFITLFGSAVAAEPVAATIYGTLTGHYCSAFRARKVGEWD